MTERAPRDVVGVVVPTAQLLVSVGLFWLFGATEEKDLFDAAMSLPWFIMASLAGLPVAALLRRLLESADLEGDLWETRRVFTSSYRGLVSLHAVITAMGVLTSRWVAAGLFPGVPDTVRLASVLRIGFVTYFLMGSTILLTAGAQAKERRALQWAAPSGHLIGVFGAIVGIGGTPGVEDLAWGGLVGSAVGLVVVAWRVDRAGIGLDWTTPWAHRSLRSIVDAITPSVGLAALFGIEALVPAIGGQYAGAGAIGVLTGVRWLVVAAASLTVLPIAIGDAEVNLDTDGPSRWLRGAVVAEASRSLPFAALGLGLVIGLSSPLVASLFQRGAFQQSATETAALLTATMSMSIPFNALSAVIRRYGDRTGQASKTTIGAMSAVALASIPGVLLAADALGSSGVALTWTVVVSTLGATTVWSWFRGSPAREKEHLGRRLINSIVAAGATAALGLTVSALGSTLEAPAIAVAVVGVIAAGVGWFSTLRVLGVDPEIGVDRIDGGDR